MLSACKLFIMFCEQKPVQDFYFVKSHNLGFRSTRRLIEAVDNMTL